MITINYTPTKCQLTGDVSKEISDVLYNLLSFQVSGYEFMPSYVEGRWDGYLHYYSTKTHVFKPGLLSLVTSALTSAGIEYSVTGFPELVRYAQQGDYVSRDYQEDVLASMFSNVRGIVKSPPRSGKTLIAGAFLDQSRLFPAVFLCNSIDIASQTLVCFKKYIPDCEFGFIGDGEFSIGDVTICTVQAAISAYEVEYKTKRAKRRIIQGKPYKKIGSENILTNDQRLLLRELFETAQTFILDECHHSAAVTSIFLFTKIISAKAVFGLSATPGYGTEDDLAIEATLGRIFYDISYHDLISRGWLLPPKIFFYKLPKHACSSNMYPTIYSEAIVNNTHRNTVISRLTQHLNSKNKTVLIVVDKKLHGDNIAALLPNAVRLYGDAELQHRNSVKSKFNSGEIKCVISTLWDEGVDIPGLHYVINAAGGTSPIDTHQRLRSITPNPNDPNKKFGGVIDFIQREKYLRTHYAIRRALYEKEPDFLIFNKELTL